ncbi:hypothetical protein PoB_001865300 [Plakobranchus ocellatus]|uniref:Uncharacterized protein n=1 Tax=Plakobranchus ocellatus TaxID=259542 RepID=A0AAV3ZBP8_9GAST|nr:hypothetical protein PoB_001865300 [Plakobranchus ocellatus]
MLITSVRAGSRQLVELSRALSEEEEEEEEEEESRNNINTATVRESHWRKENKCVVVKNNDEANMIMEKLRSRRVRQEGRDSGEIFAELHQKAVNLQTRRCRRPLPSVKTLGRPSRSKPYQDL